MHHAQLLITPSDSFLSQVERFFLSQGIVVKGNPDVSIQTFESLGVDDARAIKEAAYRTASRPGAESWHVVYIENATHQAQNALLKVLEEPPQNTFFLIGVAHEEVLLPTVRSRLSRLGPALLHTIEAERAGEHSNTSLDNDAGSTSEAYDAQRFLSGSLPERIAIVQPYFGDKEPIPSTHAFLDALEKFAAKRIRTQSNDMPAAALVKGIIDARTFLYGSSPSKKLLLENLALQLPFKG